MFSSVRVSEILAKRFLTFLVLAFLLAAALLMNSAWAATPDIDGVAVFKTNCASCHGDDGAGTSAGFSLNVADLRSKDVQGLSNNQLEQIVKNGKENMPAFSGNLSDQQIAAVVAHVRTFGKDAATHNR